MKWLNVQVNRLFAAIRKVIKDTLQEQNGSWSIARLMIATTFFFNLWACWVVIKANPKVVPDIPVNWAGLIAVLYGIIKGAGAYIQTKGAVKDGSNQAD